MSWQGPAVRAAIRANRFRCVDDRGAKDSYDGLFIDDDDVMAVDGVVDFEAGTADVFLEGVWYRDDDDSEEGVLLL